ncbi:Gfo/Idh/MocA family protein [Legionella sp. D16C41]|uniref:Gfo/Idh/MocA family protein n=1 Tax=Legionella sp. D16C41 TaxID=3402688 RepID=UPI003AF6FFCD
MKIGIIGCGKQAAKHITALRENNFYNIVIYDINQQVCCKLAQEYGVNIESIEDMLADKNTKGIIISTPTPSHFDLICLALKARKHVFCEKPLCENINQAKTLELLSEETGCFVQVGYVYRQVPAFRELKKMLQAPEQPLGHISFANFRIGGRGDHSAWKHKKDLGGGAINEMFMHMLDLSGWLLGEIIDVNHCEILLLRPERLINGQKISANAEDFIFMSGFTDTSNYINLQADLVTPAFSQFIEIQGDNGSFYGSIQADKPSSYYLIKEKNNYQCGHYKLDFPSINLFTAQIKEYLNNLVNNKIKESPSILDSIYLFNILEKLISK